MARPLSVPLPQAPHRLGRVRFEVNTAGERAAHSIRSDLCAGAQTWIPRVLEAALDAHDQPGRTLRIDRLEVSLTVPSAQTVSPRLLEAALCQALIAQLGTAGGPRHGDPPRVISEEHTLADALATFVASGQLPWWSPANSLPALEADLWAVVRGGGQRSTKALAIRLLGPLRTDHGARRFVVQIDPELAATIISGSGMPTRAGVAREDLAARIRAGGHSPLRLTSVVEHIRRWAGAADVPTGNRLSGRLDRIEPTQPRSDSQPAKSFESGASVARAAEGGDRQPELPTLLGGALPIVGAGLVLAHPFLVSLCVARGLVRDHRFTDSEARTRAVQLLAYLASGSDEFPEPELTLAKLLCGAELSDVVPRRSRLEDDDKAEADRLLEALVGHWKALGRTSLDGLREGFLQRPGQLLEGERQWRLTVESRGADALLARLPWALTPIYLPWMALPLLVDWA